MAGFFERLTGLDTDEVGRRILAEWLGAHVDLEKARSHLKNSIAIFSDNDQYVPLENQHDFRNKLGSQIIIEHDMGHFSGSQGVLELPVALHAALALGEECDSGAK